MCQIQEVLVFYEHIQIGLNQSLRNLLCFSSKCKDLIRVCLWRKKILINDWESIIAYREESEWRRALSSKICSKKQLRVWWWQQCNSRKTLQFLPSMKFAKSVSSNWPAQNCYKMTIGPCPVHICCLKYNLHNLTKYENKGTSKSQLPTV